MDFYGAVVTDEAEFTKFVHELTHAGAGRANHIRQHFLTDLSHNLFWTAFFAKIRKEKKKSGEALLARIKQLIDQVFFNPTVPESVDRT